MIKLWKRLEIIYGYIENIFIEIENSIKILVFKIPVGANKS